CIIEEEKLRNAELFRARSSRGSYLLQGDCNLGFQPSKADNTKLLTLPRTESYIVFLVVKRR
ncbi:hypothetical protein LINPERHAP1_LOCUS31197, partial [Linum perenne]